MNRRFLAWLMMEAATTFTVADVSTAASLSTKQAQHLVNLLRKSGHVEVVAERARNRPGVYRLVSAALPDFVDATRAWQRQAWRSMRILRRFTVEEIIRTLPDPRHVVTVRGFCRTLVDLGALRLEAARTKHVTLVYKLVHDSPLPPTEAPVTSPATEAEEVHHA